MQSMIKYYNYFSTEKCTVLFLESLDFKYIKICRYIKNNAKEIAESLLYALHTEQKEECFE